jgi:glycosyltransferase involved in cell wall biosynthesis
MVIFPSEWYETFGRIAAEAFACGVPVVASALGAMQEVVTEGETGLLFRPGAAEDLAAKVAWLMAHPSEVATLRANARRAYETTYTPEVNIRQLLEIYQLAKERHRGLASAWAGTR